MERRISNHPFLGERFPAKSIPFTFNGSIYTALEGETIAAALLANGIRTLREHEETGTPRGIYCNIGHCYECRVTINGIHSRRACMTLVEDAMVVEAGTALPAPLKKGGQHG